MATNILIGAAMGALMLAGYATVSIQSQQADQSGAVAAAGTQGDVTAAGSNPGRVQQMNSDIMGSAQSFMSTLAQ